MSAEVTEGRAMERAPFRAWMVVSPLLLGDSREMGQACCARVCDAWGWMAPFPDARSPNWSGGQKDCVGRGSLSCVHADRRALVCT